MIVTIEAFNVKAQKRIGPEQVAQAEEMAPEFTNDVLAQSQICDVTKMCVLFPAADHCLVDGVQQHIDGLRFELGDIATEGWQIWVNRHGAVL